MKQLREVLKEYYLDYLNNYSTLARFADDNKITYSDAMNILQFGRTFYNEDSTEENNLNDFIERQINHEIQSIQQDTE